MTAVYILNPDNADLTALRRDITDAFKLEAKWLCPVSNPSLWVLAGASPDDEGADALRVNYAVTPGYSSPNLSAKEVDFEYDCMEPGTYYLKIKHDAGESNVMQLVIDDDLMAAIAPTGGDKDGGDDEEQDPPGKVQQPAPTAGTGGGTTQPVPGATILVSANHGKPWQTAESSEPPSEVLTDTGITVSGLRLADMMAMQGDTVLFQIGKNSIRMEAAFLAGLGLGDYDLLSLTIEPLGGERYRIGGTAAGVPLASLGGAEVRLRYTAPGTGEVTVWDESADAGVPSVYDNAVGAVTFAVEAPGVYAVQCAVEDAATKVPPPAGEAPAPGTIGSLGLVIGGIGAVTVGGGGVLWARRRKKYQQGNS